MAVELLLLEDVANLGKIGDQVHVSPGYARNYLLPLHKAEPVTKAALRRIEKKKLELQKKHEENVAIAKAMAEKMAKVQLVIKAASGENDKLYGSVTVPQIIEAAKAVGLELDKETLAGQDALRELGSYELEVKLNAEVTGTLKVKVVRMDGSEATPKAADKAE
ncbi:MAG: 50S ribosomal protein L9 [Victivallales bacterium]|nr:50S ribosomal protein L9 [Victivallales bacterium]